MPPNYQREESMLFDYETTYKTSYKGGAFPSMVKKEYREMSARAYTRALPLKDTQTLTAWKTSVPFSMLHKPKDILRTNPHTIHTTVLPCEIPHDIDRVKAQKTRPRLAMTPAVSLDDIEDIRSRELLCREAYTSQTTRALREAATPAPVVRAPLPVRPAPANPIVLPKLRPPRVPPEWRMESASWDAKQLRGFCDPTKDFWLKRQPPKCRACSELATIHSRRKMLCQIKH